MILRRTGPRRRRGGHAHSEGCKPGSCRTSAAMHAIGRNQAPCADGREDRPHRQASKPAPCLQFRRTRERDAARALGVMNDVGASTQRTTARDQRGVYLNRSFIARAFPCSHPVIEKKESKALRRHVMLIGVNGHDAGLLRRTPSTSTRATRQWTACVRNSRRLPPRSIHNAASRAEVAFIIARRLCAVRDLLAQVHNEAGFAFRQSEAVRAPSSWIGHRLRVPPTAKERAAARHVESSVGALIPIGSP